MADMRKIGPAAASADGDAELPARRRVAVLALSLGTALFVIDNAIASVALPTVSRDLAVSPASAVRIVTVSQLVLMMAILPFSAIGDRIGHRRMYQGGQVLCVIVSLLCFFVRDLPTLIALRAVQAIGAAAALSVSSALLRGIYPARALGRGLGINSIIIASAGALAPTLGGFILSIASWPWVFAAGAPFALLSLLFGSALPKPQPRSHSFDGLAALLCASSFGCLTFGLELATHSETAIVGALLVLVGAGIAVVFVRRELRQARPILPVDLLAQRVFALSSLAALLCFIGSMTVTLSLPFRLQHDFGFSPAQVGALLAPWPLAMLIVAPIAGSLSDRVPAGLLGFIGMITVAAGFLLLAYVPAASGVIDIGWRICLCGAGFGLFIAPNSRQIVGSAPGDRAASAGALVSTTRLAGQTLGATLLSILLAAGLGHDGIPASVAAGLALLAALCSAALLLRPIAAGRGATARPSA